MACRVWFDGLIDGCCKGEPKGKKRRAPKQPPPGQALPTDMDHRLRWRICSWRMGGQDVMRLCSTSAGMYVTSLEIRHFHGNLGDESGRAMISSAWEVGLQLSSHRSNGWQPQYLKSFLPFYGGSPMRRPQAESGDLECGGPPLDRDRQAKRRLIIALLIYSQSPIHHRCHDLE